jgi:hypothetical protein
MKHFAPDTVRLELPPVPASGPEREAVLRAVAAALVARLGPATATFLASLLDEAAEELGGAAADVHVAELQEGDAA